MRRVVRLGDAGSHGGVVTTGSDDTSANLLPVARVGDTYNCPVHGPNPIITGSDNTTCNGRRVARLGDLTLCGAVLIEGSPDVFCN